MGDLLRRRAVVRERTRRAPQPRSTRSSAVCARGAGTPTSCASSSPARRATSGTSVVAALAGDPRVDGDRRARAPPAAAGARRGRAGCRPTWPTSRADGALPRRRRGDPPRLADPALARRARRSRPSNVDGLAARVRGGRARPARGALVHASSVGAYSPGPNGPRGRRVAGRRDGVPTSFYSRHKAAAERALDALEAAHPELRVVRLRPGADLQARGRVGDPAPVRRPAPALAARAARAAAGAAAAGRACASRRVHARRRRRGVPARRARRRARAAPTTSPPSRCSTPRRSAACSARGRVACRRGVVRAAAT